MGAEIRGLLLGKISVRCPLDTREDAKQTILEAEKGVWAVLEKQSRGVKEVPREKGRMGIQRGPRCIQEVHKTEKL